MTKIRHLFLKIHYFSYFSYFSYTNVLNISPKLRLDVLIKKKVCTPRTLVWIIDRKPWYVNRMLSSFLCIWTWMLFLWTENLYRLPRTALKSWCLVWLCPALDIWPRDCGCAETITRTLPRMRINSTWTLGNFFRKEENKNPVKNCQDCQNCNRRNWNKLEA